MKTPTRYVFVRAVLAIYLMAVVCGYFSSAKSDELCLVKLNEALLRPPCSWVESTTERDDPSHTVLRLTPFDFNGEIKGATSSDLEFKITYHAQSDPILD